MPSAKEKTCTICFVDGAVCDGILCAETHYTCGECFEAYVMSESGKSLGELKKREGRILCPFNTDAMKGADRCNATCFADKDIAKNVSNDAFAAYLRAREKMREEAMAEEMRKEMEQRVELERQRAGNAAEASERLRGAREHVVEKILTLSCPRCTQAFVDFEGCFALNCSRCRAAFCAYCLADCGKDAHAHVGSCPEGAASLKAMKSKEKAAGGGGGGGGARGLAGQGTTYGTRAMFDESQKRRRCKHLVLYLERHDGETQSKILEGVKTELADLGITSRELRHWQKKEDKAIAEREKKQQQANLAAAARGGGGDGGGRIGPGRGGRAAAAIDPRGLGGFPFVGGNAAAFFDPIQALFGGGGGGAPNRRDNRAARRARGGPVPVPAAGVGMDFDLDDFNAMLAAGMFDDGMDARMEGARNRGRGDGGRGNFAPWRGLNNALDGAHGNGGAEVGAIRAARRARREREAREKAERANRPPEVTHVDLVGATTTTTASKKKNLPPGGGGNGGAAAGGVIAIDLTDGVSPTPCGGDGGPTGRSSGVGRRVRARMEVAAENGGSQDSTRTVDLT